MFTPQVGETSYEILPREARLQAVRDMHDIRSKYPKLSMTKLTVDGFLNPPPKPSDCIFANITRTVTADLKTQVEPCQFGGNPDCSQCGCIASAGLAAVARHQLFGFIPVGAIFNGSLKVGEKMRRLRPIEPTAA